MYSLIISLKTYFFYRKLVLVKTSTGASSPLILAAIVPVYIADNIVTRKYPAEYFNTFNTEHDYVIKNNDTHFMKK